MRDEWFRHWFESDYYLKVYRHRNYDDAKKLVQLIVSQQEIPKKGKLLDLGCGAGRHAALFAEAGYDVFGIDISSNLLRIAKSDSLNKGVLLHLMRADLRYVPLKSHFDIVTNLFTTFGYFPTTEENFSIFNTSASLLVPGGFFIFDYLNPIFLSKNIIRETIEEIDELILIQRRKIIADRVKKDIILKKGEFEMNYCEDVRLYYRDELEEGIISAGMKVNKVYGDYAGGSFHPDISPRIIFICKKL